MISTKMLHFPYQLDREYGELTKGVHSDNMPDEKRKDRESQTMSRESEKKLLPRGSNELEEELPRKSFKGSPLVESRTWARHVSVGEVPVTHFKGTMQNVCYLQNYFRCVICGSIPPKVLSTSRCEHKYCKKCIALVEGKICLICDVKVSVEDVKPDNFFVGLAPKIEKFRRTVNMI